MEIEKDRRLSEGELLLPLTCSIVVFRLHGGCFSGPRKAQTVRGTRRAKAYFTDARVEIAVRRPSWRQGITASVRLTKEKPGSRNSKKRSWAKVVRQESTPERKIQGSSR